MTDTLREKVSVGLALLALFVLYGLVSEDDYQEALAQEAIYCDNVRSTVWPDYKQIDESVCSKRD